MPEDDYELAEASSEEAIQEARQSCRALRG
jgi:signal transduction histidine kinase